MINNILNIKFNIQNLPLKYLVSTPITDGPHETPNLIEENGVPFISVDGIQNGQLIISKDRLISKEDAKIYGLKCQPRKGDILIGKAASTGKIALVKTDEFFSIWSPLAMVRANTKIYNKYLEFYLKSCLGQEQIDLYANENTQKNIGMKDLERLCILVPPLDVQRQIADYLDVKVGAIDSLVEETKKDVDRLKKYKKTMIESLIMKYPKKKFKYLVKNIKVGPFGSDLKREDFKDSGHPIVNQRCVIDNEFNSFEEYVNDAKFRKLSSFVVKKNDLLITTRGTIGKVSIYNSELEGVLHPCIIKMNLNDKALNKYIQYIFNYTDFIIKQIKEKSNSTTIEVIYSYNLKEVVIPCPSIKEQQEIVDYLDKKCSATDELISLKEKKVETLNSYKKSLIYECVTGKKTIN